MSRYLGTQLRHEGRTINVLAIALAKQARKNLKPIPLAVFYPTPLENCSFIIPNNDRLRSETVGFDLLTGGALFCRAVSP